MPNFDLTCLDMLVKVPFWVNVVSLNMAWMVLESPRKVLEFDFEKWARTMKTVIKKMFLDMILSQLRCH